MFEAGPARAWTPCIRQMTELRWRIVDSENDAGLRILLAVVLAIVIVGGVTDLVLDAPERWLGFHVLFELALIGVSLGAALWLGMGWIRSQRSIRDLTRQVGQSRAERDAWRQSAERMLLGLGEAIDRQFDAWELTDAERETALMLLKGYSHKRIASRTARSERTVRQHAVAVYRKSGQAGRAELAAFFLEGLALPGTQQRNPPAS